MCGGPKIKLDKDLLVQMTKDGKMAVNEVDKAAFALPVGGVSEPIVTSDAAVIVRVAQREDVTPAKLNESKDTFREQLLSERRNQFFASYLSKAKQNMKIEIFTDVARRAAEAQGEGRSSHPQEGLDLRSPPPGLHPVHPADPQVLQGQPALGAGADVLVSGPRARPDLLELPRGAAGAVVDEPAGQRHQQLVAPDRAHLDPRRHHDRHEVPLSAAPPGGSRASGKNRASYNGVTLHSVIHRLWTTLRPVSTGSEVVHGGDEVHVLEAVPRRGWICIRSQRELDFQAAHAASVPDVDLAQLTRRWRWRHGRGEASEQANAAFPQDVADCQAGEDPNDRRQRWHHPQATREVRLA